MMSRCRQCFFALAIFVSQLFPPFCFSDYELMEADDLSRKVAAESGYRPEIDGLRAVSVIGVVLFHAGFGFSGGYVGVDVFFVISGFLITRQILSSFNDGSFSIIDFWERRIRRIFPPLIVMLAAVLATGYLLLLPDDFLALGKSSVSQTLMAANLYAWRDTGYFAVAADLRPLLHMWSLAVEEQFYLLLPILLWLVHRAGSVAIRGFLVISFLTSLGLCIFATPRYPSAAFFLLPTRAWELIFGSLIAAGGKIRLPVWLREGFSIAGLISIFFSMLQFSKSTVFPEIGRAHV